MISTDLSPDTRAIAEAFKAVSYEGAISLDQISAVIGRDIRRCRHLVYGAMKVALKEAGAVFATERGKGYVRLPPDQAHKIGSTTRRHIRRSAKIASKKITGAIGSANDLSDEGKRSAFREVSTLGLLEHISRDSSAPVMTAKDSAPLPVAVTAKRFLDRIGAR